MTQRTLILQFGALAVTVPPHEMTVKVFPDPRHVFDHPGIDIVELGYIVRSDPEAAAQAIQMTREF